VALIAVMLKRVVNIDDRKYLEMLCNQNSFTRNELKTAMHTCGLDISEALFKAKLQGLINSSLIFRVGRNAYCVAQEDVQHYRHNYSVSAENVVGIISKHYPKIKYSVFELVQMNEFVNHLLAHNTIFVSVESSLGDFVFDTLKESHPGNVLINPTSDIFHQYWYSNMLVITKLVTEAPSDNNRPWAARIEKILVDIMADPLIQSSISASEFPGIYTEVFRKYVVDESCLFRYAKRRGVYNEILQLIQEDTNIQLRTR